MKGEPISIEQADFNPNYAAKAADERLVRHLLSDERVRRVFQFLPASELRLHRQNGEWELYYQTEGVVTNLRLLRPLYRAFIVILDSLADYRTG